MRKHVLAAFALSMMILVSCTQDKETTSTLLSLKEIKHPLHQNELIENVNYIQLETKDESLLNEITQLVCTKNELLIFDLYGQCVLAFDYNGRFLRKLHKVGQGPQEYLMATSFSVDEAKQEMYLVDIGNKVACYDLQSFEHVKNVDIKAVAVESLGNDDFITYNSLSTVENGVEHKSHILRYNEQNKIDAAFLPIPFESGYTLSPVSRFYRFKGELYVFPPFEATIYKIEQDSCVPHYTIDYGEHSLPTMDFLTEGGVNNNYITRLYKADYVYFFQPFESDDFLAVTYQVGGKPYVGIYDKKHEKGIRVVRKTFENLNGVIDMYNIRAMCGNKFVSILKHSDLLLDDSSISEQLRDISVNLNQDSNPILMMFDFKKL